MYKIHYTIKENIKNRGKLILFDQLSSILFGAILLQPILLLISNFLFVPGCGFYAPLRSFKTLRQELSDAL